MSKNKLETVIHKNIDNYDVKFKNDEDANDRIRKILDGDFDTTININKKLVDQKPIKLSKKVKVIDIEKFYNDSTELVEYIWRRKKGRNYKAGVIIGNIVNGVIKIGWSKCNISEDPFISFVGLNMARARIMRDAIKDAREYFIDISDDELNAKVPDCIRSQVRNFGSRCLRYYKNVNKLEIPD